MDSGVSPGEAGGVLAGAIGLLYALGKGLAWLLNWKGERDSSRSERLKAWEASLDQREKEHREKIEKRLVDVETKLTAVSGALFEVCAEMQRLDPASAALARARMVLIDAYPVEPEIPEELRALLRKLDARSG